MWIDEQALDDSERLARLDSRGALYQLATAGAQVREAVALANEAGIGRTSGERPRAVIVGAVGSSAVVADALQVLADAFAPVPVIGRRNAPLPGWVGPLDLVVSVSISGRAAGPLALAAEASRRGATVVTVGADDSPLAEVARRARGVHVAVGAGRTSSRTSLWSLLTPVLLAAHHVGVVDVTEEVLLRVADRLDAQAEACRPTSDACVNPAKSLALSLSETVPMVLGESPLTGVVARRMASMLSRTARIPAVGGALPDDASDIVATFDGPFTAGGGVGLGAPHFSEGAPWTGRDIFADPFLDGPAQTQLGLVLVRDEQADASLANAVAQTAEQAGVRVLELPAGDGTPLERFAAQTALADFTGAYLALGLGLDPLVSRHVAELRDRTRM